MFNLDLYPTLLRTPASMYKPRTVDCPPDLYCLEAIKTIHLVRLETNSQALRFCANR
jgi:hypothetical protein